MEFLQFLHPRIHRRVSRDKFINWNDRFVSNFNVTHGFEVIFTRIHCKVMNSRRKVIKYYSHTKYVCIHLDFISWTGRFVFVEKKRN